MVNNNDVAGLVVHGNALVEFDLNRVTAGREVFEINVVRRGPVNALAGKECIVLVQCTNPECTGQIATGLDACPTCGTPAPSATLPGTDPKSHALRAAQTLEWLALRLVAPLVITAAMIHVTRGNHYVYIFGPLVWTLFAAHLVATFAFTRTHLLDTGSFFCLIFAALDAADIGDRGQVYNVTSWLGFSLFFALYLTMSIVGRYRAYHSPRVGRSVSTKHVVAALCLLFVAVIVCSTSKGLVGFLFVPGLLIIPFVLFWSLVSRGEQPEQPAK